jgi:hypothetical protein
MTPAVRDLCFWFQDAASVAAGMCYAAAVFSIRARTLRPGSAAAGAIGAYMIDWQTDTDPA